MEMKNLLMATLAVIMGASIVLAMSGAGALTVGATSRWAGETASSESTQGGNITSQNLSTQTQTQKWAEFYGNITGNIVLLDTSGNNTSRVFKWAWTSSSGGEVCLTQAQAGNFDVVGTTSASSINSAWSLGSAADNASNTYNLTNCSMNLAGGQVTATADAQIQGYSTFHSCALSIGTGLSSSKSSYAFCSNISASGKNFNNTTSNYEVLVPISPGSTSGIATETYYFYAELN